MCDVMNWVKMVDQRNCIDCRVCLRYDLKESDKCFSLFEKYNNSLISEKITYVTNVEIERNDGFPDKICPECMLQLETAYTFKQRYETSDKILKNIMQAPSNLCQVSFIPLLPVKKEVEVLDEELPIDSLEFPLHSDIRVSEILEDPTQDNVHTEPFVKKSRAIDLKLICDDCGGSFKSKCKLAVHWKKVHLPSKLICPMCKRIFKSVKAFNIHARKKTKSCLTTSQVRVEGSGKDRVYYCRDCSYNTKRIKDMDTHLVIHTGVRRFQCSDCPKTFTQHSSLQGHRESAHKDMKGERTCHYCGKFIRGRGKFYKHLLTHGPKKAQCEVCKKLFQTRSGLKVHMKRHSGTKSYVCELCSARFYTIGELQNHRKKVHFKEKIFKCDICDYSLYTEKMLKLHKSKHTPSNLVCFTCGMFVENAEKFLLHQKRHLEKNYSCPHCDKVFHRKDSVNRHKMKKHKDISLKQITVKLNLKKVKQEFPT